MRRNSVFCRSVWLALLPVLVMMSAETASADPSLECSIANGSQVEIGNCLVAMSKSVDAVLDAALGFARSSAKELDETTGRALALPALEAGQAAWIQYRDRHCDYVGSRFGGGSGTGIAYKAAGSNLRGHALTR